MRFIARKGREYRGIPVLAAAVTLAAALSFCPGDAGATQVEISSSLNPVGSGARAAGMGGAFIGVADDATAASWNPAGLVQLEKPEFSFVYGYLDREQNYSSALHPELQSQSMDANGINYASFAYPFTLAQKNMVVSLNYQRLFDLNKSLKTKFNSDFGGGDRFNDNVDFHQKGYLSTLTPAFAIQVIPELYLGVAVNIWDDFMGTSSWDSHYNSSGAGIGGGLPFTASLANQDKYSFSGLNVTTGFLVNLNKVSIGGVFKSPFSGKIKHTGTSTTVGTGGIPSTGSTSETETLDMPMSAGLGLAYRPSDNWLFSLDGYWTQWSAYVQKDAAGNQTNPITTHPISEGKLKDTYQARLGGEYLIVKGKSVIPLRVGFFYDPEPGAHGVDNFFGGSVGSGYTWENYSFDVAYQYRRGNHVTGDIPLDGVSSDITQHTVLSSLIYRF
jgi:long-subunit fatty acid transport protein